MKKIVSALLFCALLLSLAACSQKSPTAQETEPESSAARTVTDSFGREVTIPAEVKAIVCTGSGALRMVTYLQCTDRLVGVEDCDKEYADSTLRDYAYVYHDTFDALPSIGKGGGTANTAYVEELIRLQPDVILSGYTQEALEDLAQSTGIPCVSIRAKSINFIDDSFYTAMRVAAVFSPLINLTVNAGIVVLLWLSGSQDNGQIGRLMASVNYMTQVLFSLGMVSNILNTAVRAVASAGRVQEILMEEPAQKQAPQAKSPSGQSRRVPTAAVAENRCIYSPSHWSETKVMMPR